MRYYEALATALRACDVQAIFGVLGDANLFAMDAFRRDGGRYLSFAHEGSAVLAAAGYAATSGRVGVATVTHGPALTNTVTALVDATRSRTPLVLIAGDTDPADRHNLQNIDQRSIVLPTGAAFELARSPETVVADLLSAIRRAQAERRPVVLNIPVPFQWADVGELDLTPIATRSPLLLATPQTTPDPTAVDAALGAIASARRPIVLGGRGAAEARGDLVALAEQLNAPLATSLRGKGLFTGHAHDLGIFGTLSHQLAQDVISRSDCVIAFGASLNPWTTSKGGLLQGKRVIHIDADPGSLAASPADICVLGDAATTARQFTELLEQADVPGTGFADTALEADLKQRRATAEPTQTPQQFLDIIAVLRRLDEAFPEERTLVIDDGRFIITSFMGLGAPRPQAYVHTCSFASIGLATATAIGAYEGAPGRPVLSVCGDGGFMSAGLTELNSAVRHGTDLVVVIMNDGAYGAEHVQFRARDLDPVISTFDWPDFAPVAESLGAIGLTVRTMADLEVALERVAHRDRPVLIDVKLDPDHVPMPGY